MRISIDAPHAKEHFETAREYLILDPERIVGNPEVIPRMAGKSEHCCGKAILSKHLSGRSCAGPGERQAFCKFFNSDGCR
jgi:hypothetical protein